MEAIINGVSLPRLNMSGLYPYLPEAMVRPSVYLILAGCGTTGFVVCWGYGYGGGFGMGGITIWTPPEYGGFTFIATGSGNFACGLRDGGVPDCWGGQDLRPVRPPQSSDRFTSLAAGEAHICGLREDGSAVCWGSDLSGQSSSPEKERFVSLAAGNVHTCGLREDGVIVCWGDNSRGQSSPPLR